MIKHGKDSDPGRSEVFRFLSSMKTGLFILLLLAALSSIGTLLPQRQSPAYYVEYHGEQLGSLILMLSFDKVYSSWWFLGLGAVLSLNLLFCLARRVKALKTTGELGSFILHLSILVILTGSLISGLTGHRNYIEVGVGDSVKLADRNFSNLELTVKDFKIDYYDNHEPKQYTSELSLKTEKGDTVRGQISVNHPLTIHGIKIYQQNYGYLIGGQVEVAGKTVSFDVANAKEILLDKDQNTRLKLLFIPDFDEQNKTLQTKTYRPHNPRLVCALMREEEVIDAQTLAPGEMKELKGYPVTFQDYRYFTGLEIKQDSGTTVIFSGFVLLLLGFVVRYLAPDKKMQRGEKS